MTDCTAMADRMVEVARGGSWTGAEAQHLAACPSCAAEWRLVETGAVLHADLRIDADRVAAAVLARLRVPEPAPPGRRPWRSAVIGLVTVAAGLLLVVSFPRIEHPARTAAAADTGGFLVLPELEALTQGELESMQASLDPTAQAPAGGLVPHLDQLTDTELAQLLASEGGTE